MAVAALALLKLMPATNEVINVCIIMAMRISWRNGMCVQVR